MLPYDPEVSRAQDDGILPVTRSDVFAGGIRAIINTLFPQMEANITRPNGKKSILRLPRIRIT
jgi:hypothetical protein